MPSRQNLFMMSPELIQKIDSTSSLTGPVHSSENIVSVLEKALDSSKEIILAEERPLENPNEHVIQLEMPSIDTAEEREEIPEISEEENEIEKPDDSNETDKESNGEEIGLFEVSVDISETLSDDSIVSDEENKRSSLTSPGDRRSSRWSATVLFLASEVQMMVNLAHLSLPDGYEMAPKKNNGSGDDDDEEEEEEDETMPEKDSAVELQPIDSSTTAPLTDTDNENKNYHQMKRVAEHLAKECSNGEIFQNVCDNNDLPPPYENLDNADNHSLISNKSDKPNEDEGKEDDQDRQSDTRSLDRPPHEDWGHKADFLLAVIGYAVDLSNVWRFPYLCYRNGGGAFIIPYFTVLIFGALPIFFMELCLGQFHREGPVTVWKIAPMFKGIGYASCFMAYLVAFYYNVVIGWAFYYLFSSFTLDLPWKTCDHEWNSPNCWKLREGQFNISASNDTEQYTNHSVSSSYEFFERGVLRLHLSRGLDHLGSVRWELVMCTLLTFICLYFSLWKGVKSSGKVVYVTATVPYLILTILLIRGCLLPGAVDGIKYFITPNVERLNDPQVWIDAAVQIMFSIGAGFGTHIAYASHNKFNNNCYHDCLFTAAVNSFTSIFSGFVVFSYLGYMADRQQKDIDQVAQEGPGLVFIVYPEAIATLPGSTAWAIIFFLMLITLGMDSAGGMYVFKILDNFAAGTSIVFTVLCQVVAVSWFYGIDQFCKDIDRMIGHSPGLYWRICWKYISPTFLLIIVISSILHYSPLVYQGAAHIYVYPDYANAIGWLIACASMSIIPLYAIYYILKSKGTLKERISLGISPKWEHKEIKEKREVKRFKRQHWVYI
ncbi:sodium-dependent noradrenaline transporter-like isoform X2 [Mercenaria mercenaria]|uniref:sodium-dependent noradrenaline transporter-like isoform X2 n=1 Tax=Mercenaria mercenaria TaxID=6596 RepID=UPI00234E5D79|nr:sodium-dependent noradrenaline transporter-like isoform X2 [Mercenaria mercenaria]